MLSKEEYLKRSAGSPLKGFDNDDSYRAYQSWVEAGKGDCVPYYWEKISSILKEKGKE